MKATESVKVDKKTLNKVRKHVKKTKQTISGFYDLAAEEKLGKQTLRDVFFKVETPHD